METLYHTCPKYRRRSSELSMATIGQPETRRRTLLARTDLLRVFLLQTDASESGTDSGIVDDELIEGKPRKPTSVRLKDCLIGTNQMLRAPMSFIDCGKLADWIFTPCVTSTWLLSSNAVNALYEKMCRFSHYLGMVNVARVHIWASYNGGR
jgi:hypothetical protein